MNIYIKKIFNNRSRYNGRIIESTIIGTLPNGLEVMIEDSELYNLNNYLNKELDCLLSLNYDINRNDEFDYIKLTGKFLGFYIIPLKWFNCPHRKFLFQVKQAIETSIGIFLFTSNGEFNSLEGKNITLYAYRFYLEAWCSVII